jgi:hypothetical protein
MQVLQGILINKRTTFIVGLYVIKCNSFFSKRDACPNDRGAYVEWRGRHAVQCVQHAYLSNNHYIIAAPNVVLSDCCSDIL